MSGAGELEKADIEALYRMLYDCDEHDEYYVKQLPFSEEGTITKNGSLLMSVRIDT